MGRFVDRIQAFALALGGPGLFIIAFLDSSFLSLPEINDLLLIWMVTQHEARMVYYASCATLGSIAGCLLLYYLGRKGDEWISQRFNPKRRERALNTFQRYGVLAILIPSLLPPPAPFKIFVLLAGVAGISVGRFIAAIAIGRGVRYFGEGLLAVYYGDRAMEFIESNGQQISIGLAGLLVLGAAVYVFLKRARRSGASVEAEHL
jgi:membrane protein YqaA with SNARE-associated domain